VKLLAVQYRMHPEIRAFPSRFFYENALQDAPQVSRVKATLVMQHAGRQGLLSLSPVRMLSRMQVKYSTVFTGLGMHPI
jgi:hypothetical protein